MYLHIKNTWAVKLSVRSLQCRLFSHVAVRFYVSVMCFRCTHNILPSSYVCYVFPFALEPVSILRVEYFSL